MRDKHATITDECRSLAEQGASPNEIAKELSKTNGCNCDLDNWEPEKSTGHSCVCRIHRATVQLCHRLI